MPNYGQVDRDYGIRLAKSDDEGGIYMLNLMKYKDVADYGDRGEDGVSGREADDRYSPVDVLTDIGASVCFAADVMEGTEDWDRVAVVRYPTRRAFIEMQSRKDFQDKHVHKEAGMDHTIVMGTLPVGGMPDGSVKRGRMLVEVWSGEEPAPVVDGPSATFTVEGTIVGDGRRWTGARYTRLTDQAPALQGSQHHQLIVVEPYVQRWV